MVMTSHTIDQRFAALVNRIAPGSELRRTWQLKGGISAGMTALEIADPDGVTRKLIVRQPGEATLRHNPDAAEDEFRLLKGLQSAGIPAPTPVYLDSPAGLLSSPGLVIEYIEGESDFAPADMTGFVQQFAASLARIHRLDPIKLDFSFLPRQTGGFAGDLAEHPPAGTTSLEEGRIRQLLAAVGTLPSRNAPVLLHGDYWQGNVLWRAGKLAAVIDWEDAMLGDPLSDLVISRLDLLWIFSADAMHAFTQIYLSMMKIDDTDLPWWDLWAALRLARLAGSDLPDWAAFFHPYGRLDITEGTIRQHYRYFIGQAFEKLGMEW